MCFLPKFRLVIAAAALAGCSAMAAADAGATAEAKQAAKESVRPASNDLQKLIAEITSQRDRMIADHEALAKKLKDATETERKEILERMSEQKKAFEAAQSMLHKSIRDEQRRLRQSSAPGRR